MKIGILALQGAFAEHEASLDKLHIPHFEIRQADDLQDDMDGLIIPGGESTVMGKLLKELGYSSDWAAENGVKALYVKDYKKMAQKVGIGEPTLRDIVQELCKPGRDPRDEMPKPVLRTDVLDMKDLKEGMILKGTVRNVIDFGAFVDIGVHQDGLVHVSRCRIKNS